MSTIRSARELAQLIRDAQAVKHRGGDAASWLAERCSEGELSELLLVALTAKAYRRDASAGAAVSPKGFERSTRRPKAGTPKADGQTPSFPRPHRQETVR